MGFKGILGNDRVRDYLTAAFSQKTVPHAFLISGSDDEEKRNIAAILAQALVCIGESAPCDRCIACKKARAGTHPDIIWLDPEGNSIKVDEIRSLRRDAYILPNDGDKKAYIIVGADRMTQEAQDALLKILEEPPRFTNFILLCYNHNSMLATVMSRVTHLKLQEKNQEFISDDKEIISAAREIVLAVSSRNELEILKAFTACEKKKRDEMNRIFSGVIAALRDYVVYSSGGTEFFMDADLSREISGRIFIPEAIKIIDAINEARKLILRNVGVAHVSAMTSVRISQALR